MPADQPTSEARRAKRRMCVVRRPVESVLDAPEPNSAYIHAVGSLGGLAISGSGSPRTAGTPQERTRSRTGMIKSESLPTLSSWFDGSRATFVARNRSTRLSAQEPDVKLPPLTLTLRAARGNSALSRGNELNDASEDGESDAEQDKEHVNALHRFNQRHASCSKNARGLLSALERSENRAKGTLGTSFDTAVGEVFRNRLYIAETYSPYPSNSPPQKKRRPRRKRWRLDESTIWIGRKLRGNSLDFYETQESLRSLFETDWAIGSAALARMVQRGATWMGACATRHQTFFRIQIPQANMTVAIALRARTVCSQMSTTMAFTTALMRRATLSGSTPTRFTGASTTTAACSSRPCLGKLVMHTAKSTSST